MLRIMTSRNYAPVVVPAFGPYGGQTGVDVFPVGGQSDVTAMDSLDGVPAPDTERSDAELVRQLLVGSHAALAVIYDRYGPTIYASVVRATRDRWMAADVLQETFLALWNRAEAFDATRGSLRAWLMTIARNRAVDHLRAGGRRRAAPFSVLERETIDGTSTDWFLAAATPVAAAEPAASPESVVAGEQTRRAIVAALSTLGPLERRVIELAYGEGLSQSEVADRLGWPLGTVKTRTRRALRLLRDRLTEPEGQFHDSVPATDESGGDGTGRRNEPVVRRMAGGPRKAT